jgi:hypothetical protein
MAKFWVFTACHSGLPLAIRLKDEGHDVTVALIRPQERNGSWEKPKNAKEEQANRERIEYLQKNGSGILPSMWAVEAMKKIGKQDYVIFDQIYGWQFGDALYQRGCKVLGGAGVGYKLETERQDTLQMFKKMGFDLPMQKKFGSGSSEAVIQFLEAQQDKKLFVLKSDNPSVVTQVAEDSNEELIQKIKTEQKGVDSDSVLLQERVDGLEYNIETYYCQGRPVFCDIDIEEKRKYNSSSQVQVGCAYDLVWLLPLDHPLRIRLNKPFDKFAREWIGTGMLDISVIHNQKEDKVYPLEVCGCRFGYNQIYTLMELLTVPVSRFFMDLLDGRYTGDISSKIFAPEFGASLRIFNDESTGEAPMTFPRELKNHYWLWDVHRKNGKLITTGGKMGESPGIITAHADTPEGAYAKIREYYRKFNLTTLWARDDYQDDDELGSPLYRYHQMDKLGLL